MTDRRNHGILQIDPDGALAWHFAKGERRFRRVLFKIEGTEVIHRDPVTKEDSVIGRAIDLGEGLLLVVFYV